MAKYRVRAPNGKILTLDGPEGASEEQIISAAQQQFYGAQIPERDFTLGRTISRGFERGKEQIKSSLGDVLPALIGSTVGAEDYAKRQMQEAQQTQAYIQERLRPAYSSYKDVDSISDGFKFAAETLAEQGINLATILGTGGVGGIVGKRVAAKTAEQASKKLADKLAKQKLSQKTAERHARKITEAVKKGGEQGQLVGVGLGSYALNAPEVFQNIYEKTGELQPGAALIAGAVSASLDSVLPATILRRLTPSGRTAIAQKVLEKSGMTPSLATTALKGLGQGLAIEGLTEAAQEGISITAEKLVADERFKFNTDDYDRLIEAGIKGGIAGGGFGGVGATVAGVKEKIDLRKDLSLTNQQSTAEENQKNNIKAEITPRRETNLELEQAVKDIETQTKIENLNIDLKKRLQTVGGTDYVLKNMGKYFAGHDKATVNKYRTELQKHKTALKNKKTEVLEETAKEVKDIQPAPIESKQKQNIINYKDLPYEVQKDKQGNYKVFRITEDKKFSQNLKSPQTQEIIEAYEQQQSLNRSLYPLANQVLQDNGVNIKFEDLPKQLQDEIQADLLGKAQRGEKVSIPPELIKRAKDVSTGQRNNQLDTETGRVSDESAGAEPRAYTPGTSGLIGDAVASDTSTVDESKRRAESEPATLEDKAKQLVAKLQAIEPDNVAVQAFNDPNLELTEDNVAELGNELARAEERQAKNTATTEEEKVDSDMAKPEATKEMLLPKELANLTVKLPEDKKAKKTVNVTPQPSTETAEAATTTEDSSVLADQAASNSEPNTRAQDEVESDLADDQPMDIVDEEKPRKVLNAMTDLYKSIPVFNEGIGRDVTSILSKSPNWLKKLYMGMLSMSQKIELYGLELPNLQVINDLVQDREYFLRQGRNRIEANLENFKGVMAKYDKQTLNNWNRITLQLSKEDVTPDPTSRFWNDKNKNNLTVKQFYKLPKELQDIANYINKEYQAYSLQLAQVLGSVGSESGAGSRTSALLERFNNNGLKYYHPFVRMGDYWFEYKTKSGEDAISAAGSPAERIKMIEELKKEGATAFKNSSKLRALNLPERPPSTFFSSIMNVLDKQKVDPKVKDEVTDLYYALFPNESIRQQYRKREGTPGFVNDIVLGYALTANKMNNALATTTYTPKIENAIGGLKNQAETSMSPMAEAVYNDIDHQRSFYYNPMAVPWAAGLGYFSYLWFIGGNVSTSLVNLTQLPMVVVPMLQGEYGFNAGLKAMNNARRLYTNGTFDNNRDFLRDWSAAGVVDYIRDADGNIKYDKNGNPLAKYKNKAFAPGGRYYNLFQKGIATATLRRGVGHEITQLRSDTVAYGGGAVANLKIKADAVLGWVFQNSERANREITMIAAFDLAMQNGATEEQAIQKAIDLTVKAHSHALPELGPRYFQNGISKVMFTFKRFAQAQIYNVARLAYLATRPTKDMTPEQVAEMKRVRSVAFKQLIGIYGFTGMFAGVQGMPGYGMATLMAELLLGDDDEPYDVDTKIRQAMGDLVYKGPVNKMLGIDIAGRTGFNGMIFRSNEVRAAQVGYIQAAIETFLGPAVTAGITAAQSFEAGGDFDRGQYIRGFEKMSPSFLRNGLKTLRFGIEGARTRNGVKITDDPNAYQMFMQLFGFTNIELGEAYQRASSMKRAERKFLQRKSNLLTRYWLASQVGDRDGMKQIRKEIKEFNKKAPRGIRISSDTISRSMRTRKEREKRAVDGVTLTKSIERQIQEEYGD